MTSPETTPSIREAISRKKFLLSTGAAGTAALLGAESRAHATGTYPAYLNVSQIFTADQTFTAPAIFSGGNGGAGAPLGDPWVDVTAYGVVAGVPIGSTLAATAAANVTALNSLLSTALTIGGTTDSTNPIIYFPPGDYYIDNQIHTPLNASNFCIRGAGYQSSRLVWAPDTGTVTGSAMLQLQSAALADIRDIAFIVYATAASGSVMPLYGIQMRNAAGTWNDTPTDVRLRRVFVGGITTAGQYMTNAIAYTADSGYDGNGDHGTFYDVTIQYAGTGYAFGTYNGLNHAIVGGVVEYCTATAIDNTPLGSSTYGGSFHVYGTRFAGNNLTFKITGVPAQSNSINIVGISAGTSDSPENNLLSAIIPSTTGQQSIMFIGGRAILNDPGSGYSVYYSAGNGNYNIYGSLEFHGFRLTSPTGVVLNFPGTAPVNFFGGKLYTKSCSYAGALHYHGTVELGTPTFTSSGTIYAHMVQLGCNNHLYGTSAFNSSPPTPDALNNPQGGAGWGAATTVSVVGGDLGGVLTVQTDPSTGGPVGGGCITQVMFQNYSTEPPLVLISAGNAAAAGVMSSMYSGQFVTPAGFANSTNAYYIFTSAQLAANTLYIWNYMIVG